VFGVPPDTLRSATTCGEPPFSANSIPRGAERCNRDAVALPTPNPLPKERAFTFADISPHGKGESSAVSLKIRTIKQFSSFFNGFGQLTRQIHRLARQIQRLTRTFQRLALQIARFTHQIHQLARQIQCLTRTFHHLALQIARFTRQIQCLARQIHRLARQIQRLTQAFHHLTRAFRSLTRTIPWLTRKIL
jgi:prefoldin subunit 5